MNSLFNLASDLNIHFSLWSPSPLRQKAGRSLLWLSLTLLLITALLLFGGLPAIVEESNSDPAATSEETIAGLVLTSEDPGTLTATWDALTPAPNGYDVLLYRGSGSLFKKSEIYSASTSQTFVGLAQGNEYSVKVRARYGGRNGPWSAAESITVAWHSPDVPAVAWGGYRFYL